MSIDSAARLDALLLALRALPPFPAVPQPAPEPQDGLEAWLAEVAHARASADLHAMTHRENIDHLTRELFGQTASDLLPPIEGQLNRTAIDIEVPHDPQLTDLYDRVADAPSGPGTRVPRGSRSSVRVTVTAPAAPTAAIVRLHGGAFWMGGGEAAEQIDAPLIDRLAVSSNAAVLNVNYRLAPEHPFPATIVDTLCVIDALRGGLLDLPSHTIALVGTSSGANVATVAAMLDAKRAPSSPLAALALIVPSVLIADVPSSIRDDPAAWATRQHQLRGYLGAALEAQNPWVSPAILPELQGMPPTFAVIARHDEIAVGGRRLCRAIEAGGSQAIGRVYEMTHTVAPPEVEAALIEDVAEFLRERLS